MVALCETTRTFAPGCADDIQQGGQGAGRDGQAGLALARGKRVGVLVPCRRLVGKFRFDLAAGQPFPVSMRDFAESFAGLHDQAWGLQISRAVSMVRAKGEA